MCSCLARCQVLSRCYSNVVHGPRNITSELDAGLNQPLHFILSPLGFPGDASGKESESEVYGQLKAQSCLTLCDPTDSSLPGSSVHGIFQARVLEWVAISFSNYKLFTNLFLPAQCIHCCMWAFSSCNKQVLCFGAWMSHCGGFSCWGAWAQ